MKAYFFSKIKKALLMAAPFLLLLGFSAAFAAAGESLGAVASQVSQSMTGVASLMTSGSLVAGLGFAIGAILKFKQHKDNPTQIPVGTPIALVFIAAALLFLPSMFKTLGTTLFKTATPASLTGSTSWLKNS